jgi:hypothetical protein
MSSRGRRRKGARKVSNRSVDSELMRMNKGAALSDLERTDLQVRPRSWLLTQKPPVNFLTRNFWVKLQRSVSIVSSGSAIVETNFVFSCNDFARTTTNAGWNLVFDQYCIYSVTASFASTEPPGQSTSPPTLCTAIDYDGVASLGALQLLQNFSNATTVVLGPGMSVVRYLFPTVQGTVNTASGADVSRRWIDSSTGPNHFGLRTILSPATSNPASAVGILLTFTYVFGFRQTQ